MKHNEIIFTEHAIQRAEQIGLTEEVAKNLLISSKRQKHNIFRDYYKASRYGGGQCDVEYFKKSGHGKYPPLLFTVRYDGKQNKWIVITVTKK